jgi:TPR repeat protein
MVQKLMPVIAGIPAGSLPPEAVNPMIEAMKHFSAHVQAAEMKGAPTQKIAEYKQQYKEALNHLTKGQGAPPTPDIAPAAAMRAGGARPTGAAMRESGQIYEQQQGPSQNSVISGVANPPRPPTAA